MQSAAIALGRHGIRCNSVLPGTILTEINKGDLADAGKRRAMESRTPLGRLGQPEDLVGPIVFLASDMAAYVTGAALLVDGGMFVNRSEEHTSELQSLMSTSYDVYCLQKKKK